MRTFVFKELFEKGFIEEFNYNSIRANEINKSIPLHTELRLLMYAGIVLMTTGLGIIVYKNIDSFSHLAILLNIAIVTAFCFAWCILKAQPFVTAKAAAGNLVNDYILLLGCLLLLILVGYLQFQYNLFGERWGLATFIPMCLLFLCAYCFDHLGVLSMAVVNLAAWAGISVTPKDLLRHNDFNDAHLIYTALVLGLFLLFVAYASVKKKFKAHFAFTYKNFGVHILFIAGIAAIIHFVQWEWLWLLMLACIGFWQFNVAQKCGSFYFLTIVVLYFYFGLSYVIIRNLFTASWGEGTLYVGLIYFIATAVICVALLMRYNKILKAA